MDTQRVKAVFAEALESSGPARAAYLDSACSADGALRAEVESLLWASESSDALLGPPLAEDRSATLVPLREGPGSQIGNYLLIRQIGEGGFGVVFLAEQERPVRRRVALKVIKLGMDTSQVLARFEVERQALGMMDHPHIAKVLDAGVTESGRAFFVTELAPGVPVTIFCDREGLGVRQRLELFLLICHAISHAHQKGIIHRDIKPGNVLVERIDGGAAAPKVIDFGVARSTRASLLSATICTEARQIVGTLEYMSPEQADPAGAGVDTRGDVYSLGALLYELLAGAPPIDRASLGGDVTYLDLLRSIREVDPPLPSVRRRAHPGWGAISSELDWVAMKCLEKDRERRYPSVTALADDVARFLRDEPVQAGPSTVRYRLRKFVARHKPAVVASVLVTLAVVTAIVGTTTGLLRARAARQQAEESLGKARTESARAGAVTTFLGDVFSLAESGVGVGGEDASARDVLHRAGERIDAKLADRPREQVVARRLLAHGCERMFLYDLAAEELRKACDTAERQPAELDEARRLDLRADWALAMYLARRGPEAAPEAESILGECSRALGEAHPVTWEATQARALCISQAGGGDEAYALLKRLVETARPHPAARRASRLGRYLCNWSAALRDRGEFHAASDALREAAPILLADVSDAPASAASSPADLWPVGERSFDPIEGGGWIAREMVEAGVPEAAPLIEKYVERALARHPQGTPSISYRIEDLANIQLRNGDRTGAAAAFARAIEVAPKPRGADGGADRTRWRMATLRCAPGLTSGWRSEAMRAQVWCALDDLLRDHPPIRLAEEEVPVERLRFKLLRWDYATDSARPFAEGGLAELRAMEQPSAGTYLLGCEVPCLGAEPLRRADWLLLQPWTIALRPIVRFDGIRTDNSPNDRDWTGVLGDESRAKAEMFGLALQDGLFGGGGGAGGGGFQRIQWFTAVATSRVDLPVGRYRVSVTSDDGVRLSVDGKRVIDQWRPRPSGTSDVELQLPAGTHDLRVELFQETGGYSLRLQLAPMTPAAKSAAAALGGGVPEAEWKAGWYGQLCQDWPHDVRYVGPHALALAGAGRFRESADAYGAAIEKLPTNRIVWCARATLLAWLEDDEAYRSVARGVFDRFSGSLETETMAWVLISCAMRSELAVDEARYRELLARADAVPVGPSDRPLLALARGLARLRLHEPQAAARLFEECAPTFPAELSARKAAAELFLAVAEHQLGEANSTHDAFARGERIIQTQCRQAGVEDVSPFGFESWLLAQYAFREARARVVNAGPDLSGGSPPALTPEPR